LIRWKYAELGVHAPAERGNGLAEQSLRGIGGAGGNDHAGAFAPDGHAHADPTREHRHLPIGDIRDHHHVRASTRGTHRAHVCGAEHLAEIRRVDRRRLDADDDLVVRRFGQLDVCE
jgi:hypothetical protein